MDDLPRQKLRAIVSAHGRAVCNDSARVAELLTEVCPEHPREVEVLSQALDELLSDDTLSSLGERPWPVVANHLVDELMDHHSATEEDAQWAATSWGIALGEISPDQPGSQLAPLPTNGSDIKRSEHQALTQPGPPALGQPGSSAFPQLGGTTQPRSPAAPEYPFAKTPRQAVQAKTIVLMVVAIVVGLIASSMTFRMIESSKKESLYRNQPTIYWSQKLQEPIQKQEAADFRRGDPEAVPVLIELMQDQNSIVRQEAILILARIGGPARSAVPALQQALKDPDEQVRARATTALKQIEMAVEVEANRR
jgi:hypothetical protein